MSRAREYRIKMRKKKIKHRKNNIKQFGYFMFGKRENMIYGNTSGYLSRCHYGCLGGNRKTKTKNAYASYRHKGGYGKAILYSHHDKSQIIYMKQAQSDYENGIRW